MSPTRKPVPKTRRARGSLSEEEILTAAIAIIRRDGIDGLSMPKLAKDLGAGVMSIYWYFHSKDELLAALADRAFLDAYGQLPPVGDGSWDEELIATGTAIHRELRNASLFLEICRARPRSLVLRPHVVPVVARRLEGLLRLMVDAQVGVDDATRLAAVLFAYSRGFALLQTGAEEERNGETAEEALEALVKQFDPAKFPALRDVSDVGAIVSTSDRSYDAALRLLVAGMKAQLTGPRRPG